MFFSAYSALHVSECEPQGGKTYFLGVVWGKVMANREVEPNVKDYDSFYRDFKWEVPEFYNYAWDVFDKVSERLGKKVALITVSPDGNSSEETSFIELRENSRKFSKFLIESGIRKGDRVLIMTPRIPEWYYAMLGMIRIGVLPMPTPTLSTGRDLEYRINRAEARAAIIHSDYLDRLEEVLPSLKTLEKVIVIGESPEGEKNGKEFLDFMDFLKHPEIKEGEVEKTRSSDPLFIYFTSGTEAYPKMVLHTHAYPIAQYMVALYPQDLKEGDKIWVLADNGWVKAVWGGFFGQWQIGATVLQHNTGGRRFDPELCLRIIQDYEVTVFCAPPTAYRMLILQDLSKYDFSKLRHCLSAGEPLNPEVIKKWEEGTGLKIHDYYGQTETVALIANSRALKIKPGSMGKPTPGHDVRIVDDDGRELPTGEVGHIAVRIKPEKPPGIFKEYWKDEESTSKVFKGEWYFTGDKAYVDEDGYFWFVGRADDVIKSSGYRIGPFEVESALIEHPAVAEAAVIGVPDEVRGQIVKAFVVLKPGYEPSQDLVKELQEHVKRITAPYKYPREIEFVKELPKTMSGKIKRKELRKMELKRRGVDQ